MGDFSRCDVLLNALEAFQIATFGEPNVWIKKTKRSRKQQPSKPLHSEILIDFGIAKQKPSAEPAIDWKASQYRVDQDACKKGDKQEGERVVQEMHETILVVN